MKHIFDLLREVCIACRMRRCDVATLDMQCDGKIQYREYLIGSMWIKKPILDARWTAATAPTGVARMKAGTMTPTEDEIAIAIAVAQGCGCQVGGLRVLCDHPEARDSMDRKPTECQCRESAKAVMALYHG